MTLRVFWMKCGSKHGNFGDVLTPLLLDYLNVRFRWAPSEQAELVGIGSICHKVPMDFQGAIWSAGNICDSQCNSFPYARVLALRGELTSRNTKCDQSSPIQLGDGGLLADVMAPRVTRQNLLGVIPHYVDTKDRVIREFVSRNQGTCLIDICDHPREVIRRVAQCEFILSSSLHGLILADSLGIPNARIRSRRALSGGDFKFHDYYSVYGIEAPSPRDLKPTDSADELVKDLEDYQRPGINEIKNGLWDSLSNIVGAKGRAAWDSLTAPASLRAESVKKPLDHPSPNGRNSATSLRASAPTLLACNRQRKQFICDCVNALEELWERGLYHRDLRVENVSLVNGRPRFTGFEWALPSHAVIPDNPMMQGNHDLRSRDLAGLGQVFAAVSGPEDTLMQMVIEILTQSNPDHLLTSLQELRVLLEAALDEPDAPQAAAEDGGTIRQKVMRSLLVQMASVRNQCTALKQERRDLSRHLWLTQVEQSIAQLCSVIPADDAFVLVDEGTWYEFVIPKRRAIPFLEQAGEYAGMPVDGNAAVVELQRTADLGATHVVIPADRWWCLEHYSEMSRFLETFAQVAFESSHLRIYKFSHVKQTSDAK